MRSGAAIIRAGGALALAALSLCGCGSSGGRGLGQTPLSEIGINTMIQKNKTLIEKNNDYDRALDNLEQAVQWHPRSAALWYWLGIARYHKTLYDPAIAAFEEAFSLQLYPTYHLTAYQFLGWSHFRQRRYREAIESYSLALKIDPCAVDALDGRGWAYLQSKTDDAALADFEAGLHLDPRHESHLRGKAWVLYRRRRYSQAVDVFTRALAVIEPRMACAMADAYEGRGWSYYDQGRFEEARKDLAAAIDSSPVENRACLVPLIVGKALCWFALGDKEAADRVLAGVQECKYLSEAANPFLAVAAYALGDTEKAWDLLGGRGVVGVACQDYDRQDVKGAVVESLVVDGPAAAAGLSVGDVVVALDRQPIATKEAFMELARKLEPGAEARFAVLRAGVEQEIVVPVASAEALVEADPLLAPLFACGVLKLEGTIPARPSLP